MEIINKKSKIGIAVIMFLEFIFIIRTFIIYSFYKNDELYGDGIPDMNKYDNEYFKIILYSLSVTLLLVFSILIVFRNGCKK